MAFSIVSINFTHIRFLKKQGPSPHHKTQMYGLAYKTSNYTLIYERLIFSLFVSFQEVFPWLTVNRNGLQLKLEAIN